MSVYAGIMKKFIVAILAFSYLVTSIGATIHLHYCMDKLVTWSLSDSTEGDKCENCGMKKEDNCCKDEKKVVKNITDQKTSETFILNLAVFIAVIPSFASYELDFYSSTTSGNNTPHAPPIESNQEIYLRNCVFLI